MPYQVDSDPVTERTHKALELSRDDVLRHNDAEEAARQILEKLETYPFQSYGHKTRFVAELLSLYSEEN
jgi:hypothetical protein